MNYKLELTQQDIESGILEMSLEDIKCAIYDGYFIDVKTEIEAFKQLRHTLLHLDVITYNEINKMLAELTDELEIEDKLTFETLGFNHVFKEGLFKSGKLGIYAVNKEMYSHKCYNINSFPEILNIFAIYEELINLLFRKFDEYTGDIFITAEDRFEELFKNNLI